MSVKAARYIFRNIHGRIVPIRANITRASEAVNKLADEAHALIKGAGKKQVSHNFLVGRGVDFDVFGKFSGTESVLKLQRATKGTANHRFIKAYPELKDKVALSKALGDNLPNYGIPTVESSVVRFKGKQTALIQPKVENTMFKSPKDIPWHNRVFFEGKKLKDEHGLNLDMHAGNRSPGSELIDTGINLRGSSIRKVKASPTAKEILGVEGYWNTLVKKVKPEAVTDVALLHGSSRKGRSLMKGKLFEEFHGGQYLPGYTIRKKK